MRSLLALPLVLVLAVAGACAVQDSGGFIQAGGADGGADAPFAPDVGFGESGVTGTLVITPPSIGPYDVGTGQAPPSPPAFKVTLDGQDVTAKVTWSADRPDVGDVDGNTSTFVPTSKVGGVDHLTATLDKAQGTATASVIVHETLTGGLTSQQQALLDKPGGGGDPSASVVYPNDGTVFPLGVLGPQIQWNGATASDTYKLEIKEKYYDYVEYFANAPAPFSHLVADDDWAAIASSGDGPQTDPVSAALTRATGSTAYDPMTQTWHVAQSNLHGVVYYWQIPGGASAGNSHCCGNGSIVRLKPGDTAPSSFISIPNSWAPGGGGNDPGCWGCHSVSRDGTKMVASFQGTSALTLGTVDLAGTPKLGSVVPQNPDTGGVNGVFDNTGNYILFSAEGNTSHGHFTGTTGGLDIMDANTGAILKTFAMPAGCGEPAWSPDGKTIAASCQLSGNNCANGWAFECSSADIWVAGANGTTFTNPHAIVPGAGSRNGQPDFSPDSKWLVYTRLKPDDYFTSGSYASTGGDLYLTDVTGANVKHLLNASGSVADQSADARFAPLRAGGYSWIVFLSRRDYGNTLVGKERAQLWVAAIDDPPGAADPSHPAFYLRGQDGTSQNEQAQFALPPCKQDGESCSAGFDCCGHESCVKQGGSYVCGKGNGCASVGNACQTAADCCDGNAQCLDGYCSVIVK